MDDDITELSESLSEFLGYNIWEADLDFFNLQQEIAEDDRS